MSIRWRLLGAIAGVALVVTIAVVVAVRSSAVSAARARVEADFERLRSALVSVSAQRLDGLGEALDTALSDSVFRGQISRTRQADNDLGLGGGDPAAATNSLAEAHRVFASAEFAIFKRYPAVGIFNAEGDMIYTHADPARFGRPQTPLPIFKKVMEQGQAATLALDDDMAWSGFLPKPKPGAKPELYLVRGHAVSVGGFAIGAAIAGEPVKAVLLPVLAQTADAVVALVPGDGAADGASAGPRKAVGEPEAVAIASGAQKPGPNALVLDAEVPGIAKGATLGRAFFLRDLEAELGPFESRLRVAVFTALVLAFLIGLPLALFSALAITRPLLQLEKAVAQVQGGDLDIGVPASSNDEVGRLGRAFNAMTLSVREKMELQRESARLKEADEAKARLFANVNHELRTPLTLILGPIEARMAENPNLPPSEASFLQSMAANARRLLRQVNVLLDISKLDSGRMPLNLLPARLGKVLDELILTAKPQADRLGLTLETGGFESVPEALFDPEKIETIAANLLSNALKYTPSGGTVSIIAAHQGEWLVFEVADTGTGIPESARARLFERFAQSASATTRKVGGTGLGLALSKDFAKLHGGDIDVESQTEGPDHGTKFRVWIPYRPLDDAARAQAAEDAAETKAHQVGDAYEKKGLLLADLAPEASTGGEDVAASSNVDELNAETDKLAEVQTDRKRVLYCDDTAGLRDFVRSLLSREGYLVWVAVDGKDGIEKARKYKPDIVLSDVAMPRMSGVELCLELRRDPELKGIPLVLLSAKSSIHDRVAGLTEGADDYMTKPFSNEEFLARVRNLLLLRHEQTRLRKELDAAREIQQRLLPKTPIDAGGGAIFEAVYHSCEQLSGDFYDFFTHGDWKYFYLADVTSHGTVAAQVTYLLKEIFRSSITKPEAPDLPQLFTDAHTRYKSYGLSQNVAMNLVRFNSANGLIEGLRAGAPSGLIIGPGGTIRRMDGLASPLLSASNEAFGPGELNVASTKLAPGEQAIFYSDGAYEFEMVGGGATVFGRRRLEKLLAEMPTDSTWGESVVAAIESQREGTAFDDDVTLLRVKARPA